MTATERLRALLDERGVEWQERVWGGKHSVTTFWCARGVRWHYRENRFDELRLHADGLTPEQAVEATLGRGTCKVDVLNTGDCAGYECSEYIMHCNACGNEFGHVLYNEDGDVWMSEPPNYCPNCGRKVVSE